MPYTGPGSVIGLLDEFLAHWAGVNAAQAPGGVTAVPEKTNTVKSRNDLNILRGIYFAVQSAPGQGTTMRLWLPAAAVGD